MDMEKQMTSNEANNGHATVINSIDGKQITQRKGQTPKKQEVLTGYAKHFRTPRFYGGPIGAFILAIAGPILAMLSTMLCNEKRCRSTNFKDVNLNIFENFNYGYIKYIFGVPSLAILLFKIPLGRIVYWQPYGSDVSIKYRLNGYWVLASVSTIGITSAFLGAPLHMFTKYLQLSILMNTIFCFILSAYLYFKSFKSDISKINPLGNTGNVIYDFCVGRELNPYIGNINIKRCCHSLGFVFMVAICSSYIADLSLRGGITPTTCTGKLFSFLGVIFHFMFEEEALTTFTFNHQGTGFFTIFSSVIFSPLMSTMHSRYIIANGLIRPEGYMLLIGFITLMVYLMVYVINSDKCICIRYPDAIAALDFQWIPAKNNRRLLISGFWGKVRHPNYLIDILNILLSCLITGFTDPISYSYFIYIVINTLHHIRQVEEVSQHEFGDAWYSYCDKVKYKLLKYVY